MLTLPKQAATPAWHQQPRWRKYVTQLFALISRRMNFTCEFRSGNLIAGVLPEARRLFINPALIPVPPADVRFDPGTEHARRVMLLRAVVAHEAGHVAFSGPKPAQVRLGWVWNALEDERMERLVVRRHPELLSDFAFLGDAMLLNTPAGELDLLNACLMWRWAHDRQDLPFRLMPEDEVLWLKCIRPLVESAWDAPAGEVQVIAQQILNALPPPATNQDLPSAPLSADGGGMTETGAPSPVPAAPSTAPAPSDRSEAAGDGGAQDGQNGPVNQELDDSDAGAGESGEQDEQGDPETQAHSQSDADESTEDQAPAGPGSDDDGQATDDLADTEAQVGQPNPANEDEERSESKDRPAGKDDQHTPGDASAEGDAPGTQRMRAQGEGQEEANPSAREDWADPGAGAGNGLPLPSAPEEDLRPGAADVFELEAHARRLSSVLAPQGTPAHQQRSRSKGRFRYDRYVAGAERYFQRRVGKDKPAPFVLQLLVDTSGSMDGERLTAAHRAALLLCRAAFLARSDVRVITFNFDAQEVVPLHTPWMQTQAQLAHLRASGGTNLAPALELARGYRPPPTHREVIGIICDGDLRSNDIQRCGVVMDTLRRERTTPPIIFPLLIGEGLDATDTWRSLFGTAIPVLTLDDIALTLKRCLTQERRNIGA